MAIVKEADEAPVTGVRAEAGRRAERQMAHYLRRAFAETPAVRVFNDLRLERDGEVAQIDHLLLHRHVFVIIESKSVHDAVSVDARGEWRRRVRGRWQGMPSPIEQARRQGELLRAVLNDHMDKLLGKVLGLVQARFYGCPIDLLVAVSDEGSIERKGRVPDEIHKADQTPGAALEIMRRHRRAAGLMAITDPKWGGYTFRTDELERIEAFLLDRHTPRAHPEPGPPAAEPDPTPGPTNRLPPEMPPSAPAHRFALRCRHCNGADLHARSGRYGYYVKCAHCDGNTPIPKGCDLCGRSGKVRKQGDEFLRVCEDCGVEELVWCNASG